LDVESGNLRQITALNQRGGPDLSVVELIRRGTLSVEMAALCWTAIARGSSLLTGAVPGGVGKTTLMAALLAFLPPGEPIVTVSEPAVIERARRGELRPPATLLAHEIGTGHWFGYIWGREAVEFFGLWRRGLRRVSCIHTDDPEQTWQRLGSLGAAREDFLNIGLQLHMVAARSGGALLRRVSGLYVPLGGAVRAVYRWRAAGDEFERVLGREDGCRALAGAGGAEETLARWRACEESLRGLLEEGVGGFEQVRRRIVMQYREWAGPV